MRAVWYDRQGPARDVLTCGELPTPEPGTYEVRVKLEAAGLNPSDTYRRRGPAPAMEYPRVITCSDGAGTVDRVGAMVPESWVGKRVWLYNGQRNGRWMGTAAEYIALNVDLVTELPAHVSFAEGATLGVPGMTAHHCVFVGGPVQGRTLLVTGAAGAVGHYAVQLAKWAGATVIATVSSETKAERARAGGADAVINYRQEDVAARVREITGGAGVDHVVDVDFGGNLAATLGCVRANGQHRDLRLQRRSHAACADRRADAAQRIAVPDVAAGFAACVAQARAERHRTLDRDAVARVVRCGAFPAL
jgi:NADPH2:quinone reductase